MAKSLAMLGAKHQKRISDKKYKPFSMTHWGTFKKFLSFSMAIQYWGQSTKKGDSDKKYKPFSMGHWGTCKNSSLPFSISTLA
jgi:hypothetical protein